jgi:hypothetical protein
MSFKPLPIADGAFSVLGGHLVASGQKSRIPLGLIMEQNHKSSVHAKGIFALLHYKMYETDWNSLENRGGKFRLSK